MIRVGREIEGPVRERAQVCVVGSGAGGAVAAALLAEGGRDVVLLEEGGYFRAADFTGLEREMYPLLYRDRAGQYTADGGVNVLQGRAIGGTTLINAADCERIPPEVLAHWEKVYGVEGVNEATLRDSYARVEAAIGVAPIEPFLINRNNTVLLEGAKRLGLRAGVFRHNRTGCIGVGTCMVGCPVDAKKSTDLNYVPRAVAAGARVYADARADRITSQGSRATGVEGTVLDRATGIPTHPIVVEAERVVLAAGAIHTPLLLQRSGLGGSLAGRNLSLQPQVPVFAVFPDQVEGWKGIPQSVFMNEFDDNTEEHGLGGYRVEPVAVGPALTSGALPGFGKGHLSLFRHYPRAATALTLVPDRPGDGRVILQKSGAPRIDYPIQDEWRARARKGIAAAIRCYLEMGAEMALWADEAAVPIRRASEIERIVPEAPLAAASARLISAHCQGTCRMGEDPQKTVTDSRGSLHGAKGVTVCDTSLFPSSAATHTMVPAMVMADLIAHHLLAAGA